MGWEGGKRRYNSVKGPIFFSKKIRKISGGGGGGAGVGRLFGTLEYSTIKSDNCFKTSSASLYK